MIGPLLSKTFLWLGSWNEYRCFLACYYSFNET